MAEDTSSTNDQQGPSPGDDLSAAMPGDHPAVQALQKRYGDIDFNPRRLLDRDDVPMQVCVTVPPKRLLEVMDFLYHDPATTFEQLSELNGVDYLQFRGAADRFCVTYGLLSLTHHHRLWVKVFVNEPDLHVPSVTSIWKGANWMEREVYDLFGVVFDGHPDLRRILTDPDQVPDHALRKDYPLKGKAERVTFEKLTRDSA